MRSEPQNLSEFELYFLVFKKKASENVGKKEITKETKRENCKSEYFIIVISDKMYIPLSKKIASLLKTNIILNQSAQYQAHFLMTPCYYYILHSLQESPEVLKLLSH